MHHHNPTHIPASKAARIFGITPQTLHTWRKKGHVHAVRLPNGHYLVPVAEVTRIIDDATLLSMTTTTRETAE